LDCRRCGAQISDDAAYCSSCGQSTAEQASDPQELPVEPQAVPRRPKPQFSYAGFWLRAVAFVIDNVVLYLAAALTFFGPLMKHAGLSTNDPWAFYTNPNRQVLAVEMIMLMLQWLYWALLESSAWQATVGKRLLGLYVTDLQGKRLSFARASGRFFGKLISELTIGIGFLMAGFTPKKQALHDMIAHCLVLKKTSLRS
jgi:uncharacterized RDD family membrane protein YckC